MATAINTFRIWRNVNGSPVKVTVRQGHTVTYRTFRDYGDGDYEHSVVTLTADGTGVIEEIQGVSGCPVDGAEHWESDSFIPRGFVQTNPHLGVLWPTYVTDNGLWSPVRHMGDLEEWHEDWGPTNPNGGTV